MRYPGDVLDEIDILDVRDVLDEIDVKNIFM